MTTTRCTTAVAATLLAVGLGLLPAAAHAGDQERVRARDLLSRSDVAGAFGAPRMVDREVGRGDAGLALSACTGETRFRDTVGARDRIFHTTFRVALGSTRRAFDVTEQIAGRGTRRKAASTYRSVLRQVEECRHEPAGHWRYGRVHRVTDGLAKAAWMPAIDGDGRRAGGYVVVVSGRHVGVVESLGGRPVHVRDLATAAMGRLG